MVEPIAGIFGALAVVLAEPILPYALAFAAGAMIYVVIDDIVPEAQVWWVREWNITVGSFRKFEWNILILICWISFRLDKLLSKEQIMIYCLERIIWQNHLTENVS